MNMCVYVNFWETRFLTAEAPTLEALSLKCRVRGRQACAEVRLLFQEAAAAPAATLRLKRFSLGPARGTHDL